MRFQLQLITSSSPRQVHLTVHFLAHCSACLGAACCGPLTACFQDANCTGCLTSDPNAPQCQQDPNVKATLQCIQSTCMLSCQ